ncbi:MAG: IS66 family insertion sequence element accessory protein TnpB [Fibrobacterota bacterium]|nr:IS66 family insertion sequence element accessory protein TnpB [Fibrobacterota bacterium]
MLSMPPSVRVFLCLEPTDMRKGIDGLSVLVENRLHKDALSGHLFCFFNKSRDKVKVLFWDTTGFCLYFKRLERGRFHLGNYTDGEPITPVMLQLILEGLELSEAKRHRRFSLPRTAA